MLHARICLRVAAKSYYVSSVARCISPRRTLLTLAIETSCDDTAVAILERSPLSGYAVTNTQPGSADLLSTNHAQTTRPAAQLLFNKKVTAPNSGLGGIHPIEALESHQANLSELVSKATEYLPDALPENCSSGISSSSVPAARTFQLKDGRTKRLPDFISVTRGPGMRSNLTCGLDTAKGLAVAWQVPLLGVHHMQAHALTPRLVHALEAQNSALGAEWNKPEPCFPFLTMLVSGGHTMLLQSTSLVDHKILATTRDVAIGDALDKCGRTILTEEFKLRTKDTAFAKYLSDYGFPDQKSYKEWPVPRSRQHEIDKPNNQYGWQVQSPLAGTRDLAYSFTGIATSIERLFKKRTEQAGGSLDEAERILFAQTALGGAIEHLASRTLIILEALQSAKHDVSTLVVSGGVAANSFLRYFLREMLDVRGFQHVKLLFPPVWLCTDNAAMIAWCGMEMFEAGYRTELDIRSLRKWSMDSAAEDGGILGASGWIKY